MIQQPMMMPPQAMQPMMQPQQCVQQQPSYNAVKIDIINPQVNPNQPAQPMAQQYYNYPQVPVYDYPQQSVYMPQQPMAQPVYPQPVVPQPVLPAQPQVPQVIQQPQIINQAPQAPAQAPVIEPPAATAIPTGLDLPSFKAGLASEDLEVQGNTIEKIAEIALDNPAQGTQLLDKDIVDGLLAVLAKDSTTLAGPTPAQQEIRQKILSGVQVSEQENAEANKISPMETAERNKQYSLYTISILQNLLGSEVEKQTGAKVEITDLPGIPQVVETVKSNPNPMLRASGIAALVNIAKPEYEPVLKSVFEIAQTDADPGVQNVAKDALSRLTAKAAPQEMPQAAPVQNAAA